MLCCRHVAVHPLYRHNFRPFARAKWCSPDGGSKHRRRPSSDHFLGGVSPCKTRSTPSCFSQCSRATATCSGGAIAQLTSLLQEGIAEVLTAQFLLQLPNCHDAQKDPDRRALAGCFSHAH
jgi:hypothetical protein